MVLEHIIEGNTDIREARTSQMSVTAVYMNEPLPRCHRWGVAHASTREGHVGMYGFETDQGWVCVATFVFVVVKDAPNLTK